MTHEQEQKYAELVLWCVGGVDGRRVVIITEPLHRPFAVQVARSAYEHGAELVTIDYTEPLLARARVELAADHALGVQPAYALTRTEELGGPEWTLIRIGGSGEPDYLAGLDPDRIAVFARSVREINMPLLEPVTRFRKHWVGVLMATPALAAKAFPDLAPADALSRYDAEIVRVLALDEPDPVAVWKRRFAGLRARRDRYNALDLDSIRLTGPATDLEIGFLPGTAWATAEAVMPDGRTVYVNMPSLEVFTSPHRMRTNGRVAATRPYLSTSSPGTLIRGAWFEFRDGAVVDAGAESGGEVLAKVLEMDENARYLGEIALVDSRSAVAQADITFFNTLYDENASIHMALGRGFPRFVQGTDGLSREELVQKGVNHSLVHDDVMIGSEEIDVDGIRRGSGETVPLMRAGRFVEE
jgi:aminopeptidase